MINDRFQIVRSLKDGELPVRAGPFAHDSLDVRHFFSAAELVDFGRNKFEQLV